ncbi:MAG: hypothetical protein ACT4O9_07985, partial [Blastocatellia bacterium]
MKLTIFALLAFGICGSALAQGEPAEPCCGVIFTDSARSLVTVRDRTTGQLYQFRPSAADMGTIRLNHSVNVSSGRVTAINGAGRTYVTVRPDPAEPCCSIINIQPDPAEPCCGAVSYKNNTTNNIFSISVPKDIAATLKIGQPVAVDGATGLAVVQTAHGDQMSAYGYAATSSSPSGETPGKGRSAEKWVVSPVPNMKGVQGKFVFPDYPSGLEWVGNFAVTNQPDKRYIGSLSGSAVITEKYYLMAPGEYLIHLNNIPVENVPVQKGHATRLKAGFLNVVSQGRWEIYNDKKKYLTSYNRP